MPTTESTLAVGKYDQSFLTGLLETMLKIRHFEEVAAKMYGLKKIGGFLHLYIGEEAVATGAIAALDLSLDAVFTAYRDHGHAIACGSDMNALMAELFGKATGIARGKGGSMHFFDREKHFFGGNGIVGAHIPLAAGYALKLAYNKEPGVVLCMFGDGAIHQGSFHETLNMAKIWQLPVVFICENNQYGMGTFYERVSSQPDFYRMGAAYGIDGIRVDGMNVLSVYETVREVVARLRKEPGPALLEIRTYRYKGHSMSDPGLYRSKDELAAYRELDPILILMQAMIAGGLLDEAGFTALDTRTAELAEAAADFAEQGPEPAPGALYEDILVEE